MIRIRLPIAAILLAGLVGCASITPHAAAPIQVPKSYDPDNPGQRDTLEMPDADASYPADDIRTDAWWQYFGDPRLNRMIDKALAANNNLAAAGLTLRKARLEAGLSETDLWPNLNGNVSASGSRDINQSDSFDRGYNASLSLSWQVDLWGKLRGQRDIAQWEAEATAQDLQDTALALVVEVVNNYWQLAYLNQRIATGESNLDRLETTLELVNVQYQAGAVSGLEPREASQNLATQRTMQSQLIQQRVETRNAIAILLGGQPWPTDDEPQNLDHVTRPDIKPGLPTELLSRRPDLRAAELRLRKALQQIKVTASSFYPSFNLAGSLGSSSTTLAEVINNPIATLGAGLTLPFLNIHQAQLETRVAGTQYEIAASQFRTTLYTALSEVQNALSARQQLALQVDSAQTSFIQAQEIEQRYEARYQAGATDLRTWLDARQTLRNAQLALAQARLTQLQNDLMLIQALGGSP